MIMLSIIIIMCMRFTVYWGEHQEQKSLLGVHLLLSWPISFFSKLLSHSCWALFYWWTQQWIHSVSLQTSWWEKGLNALLCNQAVKTKDRNDSWIFTAPPPPALLLMNLLSCHAAALRWGGSEMVRSCSDWASHVFPWSCVGATSA